MKPQVDPLTNEVFPSKVELCKSYSTTVGKLNSRLKKGMSLRDALTDILNTNIENACKRNIICSNISLYQVKFKVWSDLDSHRITLNTKSYSINFYINGRSKNPYIPSDKSMETYKKIISHFDSLRKLLEESIKLYNINLNNHSRIKVTINDRDYKGLTTVRISSSRYVQCINIIGDNPVIFKLIMMNGFPLYVLRRI